MAKRIKKRSRKRQAPRAKGPKERELYQKRLESVKVSPTAPTDDFLEDTGREGTAPKEFEGKHPQISPSIGHVGIFARIFNVTNLVVGIVAVIVAGIIGLIIFFTGFQSQVTENSTNISNLNNNMRAMELRTTEKIRDTKDHINRRIDDLSRDVEKVEDKIDEISKERK